MSADRLEALALVPLPPETQTRLALYVDLLDRWRQVTNLISEASFAAVWTRHIADSAQLLALAPHARRWVDMGSGAGFPGLVIAIQLADVPGARVHCLKATSENAPSCAKSPAPPARPPKFIPAESNPSTRKPLRLWTPSPRAPSPPCPDSSNSPKCGSPRARSACFRADAPPRRSSKPTRPAGSRDRLRRQQARPRGRHRSGSKRLKGSSMTDTARFPSEFSRQAAASSPRVLVLANQKGGVGKTTTAINLGTALAAIGERVLIIDLDPQGNASTGLGIDRKSRTSSTYDALVGERPLAQIITPTAVPRLLIAPSTMDLARRRTRRSPAMPTAPTSSRTPSRPSLPTTTPPRRDHLRPDRLPALAQPPHRSTRLPPATPSWFRCNASSSPSRAFPNCSTPSIRSADPSIPR